MAKLAQEQDSPYAKLLALLSGEETVYRGYGGYAGYPGYRGYGGYGGYRGYSGYAGYTGYQPPMLAGVGQEGERRNLDEGNKLRLPLLEKGSQLRAAALNGGQREQEALAQYESEQAGGQAGMEANKAARAVTVRVKQLKKLLERNKDSMTSEEQTALERLIELM